MLSPTKGSWCSQKIIPRASCFAIYFLNRKKKRKGKKNQQQRFNLFHTRGFSGAIPATALGVWVTARKREQASEKCRWLAWHLGQRPWGTREGAARQLWEHWQGSNSFGMRLHYLNPFPCGVNPDTVTVQLWKHHQLILLMPSSFQYLLIKQALTCLHNRPRSF